MKIHRLKSIIEEVSRGVMDEVLIQVYISIKSCPKPEKKFIIISYGRSGSELLRSLINSHPEIHCDSEIFRKKKIFFPKRFLENRSKLSNKKVYGHKAKVYQLDAQYKSKKKVKELFLNNDFKIIYLRRKNYFKQALSAIIGRKRQVWHDKTSNPLQGEKFKIDCDKLLKEIERIEKYEKREREILQGLDYLFINYEKDLLPPQNHQKTLNVIFDYLEVDSVIVDTEFKKTSTESISDFIENYEEIFETVKESKFAKFLDE